MEYAALISYEETEEMTQKRKALFLDSLNQQIWMIAIFYIIYHVSSKLSSPSSSLPFDPQKNQGNEAADVDSLVSAYAMAQLLNSSVSTVALAQIPREEFRLRGRWVDFNSTNLGWFI